MALVSAFGPGILLAATSLRMSVRSVHLAVASCTLGYTVAVALWFVGWTGDPVANIPWFVYFPGLVALATVVAWPPFATIAYLLATVTVVQSIGQLREVGVRTSLVYEWIYATSFCMIYVAGAMMIIRTGRVLDRTRESVELQAAAAAKAEFRAVHRARFGDLAHGWVIAGLAMAARRPLDEATRQHARTTLDRMSAAAQEPGIEPLTMNQLLAQLRSVVLELDRDIQIDVEVIENAHHRTFPASVAATVGMCAAEAVRNSIRHAGASATRRITAHLTASSLTVRFTDNGVGFDTTATSERIGVEWIRTQMTQIGGIAQISSMPGQGTLVELTCDAG
ncbi:sensor histidine kinase [Nocardia fluminea]|uniref:sensor histidine kinase n=1 Tax=Nocardia fluminea TaxID=134984 RepID=UPI00366B045C